MTTAILTSEKHQNVRVDTRATREYGDLVNRAVVVSSEINDAHKEFPILLHKDDDGEVTAHAVMGFDKDENLFVEDERWISSYIPASIARGPFSLGYFHRQDDDEEAIDIRVLIDEESPRLKDDGHPVFLELGGESPYLEGVKRVLQVVDAGMQIDKVLYPLLLDLDLLEEAKIRIRLTSEQEYLFKGYYTVNQEKLTGLSADHLQALNERGILGLLYFLVSSLGNFQRLINLKNARTESG